jgi:hypothetical protein
VPPIAGHGRTAAVSSICPLSRRNLGLERERRNQMIRVLSGERLLIASDNNYPFSDGRWGASDRPEDPSSGRRRSARRGENQ